jgi:hypothetical protein
LCISCGGKDEVCGPPGASFASPATVTIGADSATFAMFTSSANNDCTAPGAATSLSIEGRQETPVPSMPFRMTFCLPSPETIDSGSVNVSSDAVQVVDVSVEIAGCQTVKAPAAVPAGSIEFLGYCDGGLNPAGYALTFDFTVAGTRTCAPAPGTPVDIAVSGTAIVTALAAP